MSSFLEMRDLLLRARTDYAAARRDFVWPRAEHFNWALDYFDRMASGNCGSALWVVEEDGAGREVTFDEMAARSNQVANFLRGLGVRRGDRVLLMLGNEVALWEILLGAFKIGAVVVPCTMLLTEDDLSDRIDRGEVKHVIASASQADKFSGINATRIAVGGDVDGWLSYERAAAESNQFTPDGPTHAADPLLLYFTSGTTGKPKMVLHSHQSYPVGHLSTMYWIGLRPGDVHWNISSPGWAKHAYSCVFAPWNAGATVFVYNYARFAAPAVLDVLHRHPVTTLCAPPTVWRMLIQEDLAKCRVRLREAVSAGEPLNPEVIEQVRTAWRITVRDAYGQTETTVLVANFPGQRVKPGSMGRPAPGYGIELLDLDGHPADEGEICVDLSNRPIGLMQGVGVDGFHRTGDIARRDANGYLFYVGRADDVFKASDYRISPFELESILVEHPAVAEAAVVPCPDPVRTAVPKAFITVGAGFEPCADLARDIFVFFRRKAAPYKRVRRLEFCELPKTISGKIRRVELRQFEQDRSGARRTLEFFEEDFSYDQ
ncbi:MAG TPA: AMP-binding protein [Bryobacteraceae bacterium]|nr:AMP-binding protein [Bryobacteraceae bacterium]